MPPTRLTYPPPANEQDFEELCLQLLRVHCDRPQLELYAHRGESQAGVDIFDPSGQQPIIAAQCKLHSVSKGLRPAELRRQGRSCRTCLKLIQKGAKVFNKIALKQMKGGNQSSQDLVSGFGNSLFSFRFDHISHDEP